MINQLDADFDSTFVCDPNGIDGIPSHKFKNSQRVVDSKCHSLMGFIYQPRTVSHCVFSGDEAFVFLANPNHLSTWLGAIIVRIRGKRAVFWGHGFLSPTKSTKNYLRKIFFSLANDFYTYGWRAKKNAISFGFSPSRVHVGFNSLDYGNQLVFRERLLRTPCAATPRGFLKVSCISRLTTICRYDLLLEAAAMAGRKGVLVEIDFVGEGPAMDQLILLANELDLKCVFHGAIYDEERISEILFNADVTVSPGKVGLTAMHSLMFGTPVITHDNFDSQMPEVESVFPGFTGYFFKEGSVEDLAAKLEDVYYNASDRNEVRRHCFRMIDDLYNPLKQSEVMHAAVKGAIAAPGDDAFQMFKEPEACN
ncbi:MAG: glycosyltransferase family 4 protein [Luteimonas sp.]